MAIIEPNDEEKLEELPDDFSTPFSPPSGIADNIDDTHPAADTNVDSQERYDEGITDAAEVEAESAPQVIDYSPKKPKNSTVKTSNPALHKTFSVPDIG